MQHPGNLEPNRLDRPVLLDYFLGRMVILATRILLPMTVLGQHVLLELYDCPTSPAGAAGR